MMLVHSGFPHTKEFLQKLFEILAHTHKNIHLRCSWLKKFEEYQFERCHIISLPAARIYLRLALVSVNMSNS
jgi:hypothetical protein